MASPVRWILLLTALLVGAAVLYFLGSIPLALVPLALESDRWTRRRCPLHKMEDAV